VFSIDSDEEATPELGNAILRIVRGNGPVKGYRVKRHCYYLGKKMKHSGWSKDYPLRLFLRDFGKFNLKPVYEEIVVNGQIGQIENPIIHCTVPTLASHMRKIELFAELDALQKQQKGLTTGVFGAFRRGLYEFVSVYFFKAGFLDGRHGLIFAANSAFAVYMKYLMLWERTTIPNKLY
jgi:(heptosyl)LPS beta-1,4-glucosyltransferase